MPRIRLQTSSPLPALKAWFLVSADVTSVRDLKLILCSHLTILKELDFRPSQLALEMDDFEVLDESPVDLVREGDLVMLKCKATKAGEQLSRKRKAVFEEPATAEKRRKLSYAREKSPSSSSSASSSDSDTSSSSSSDSDTESSSSSDSAPSVVPIRTKQSSKAAIVSAMLPNPLQQSSRTEVSRAKAQQPTVPPGLGKPSTQNRNARRRKKRKFAAGQTSVFQDSSAFTAAQDGPEDKDSEIVLPYDDVPTDPISRPTLPIPSASLGNRNKAKGFKKSMEGVVPHKVIFDSAIRRAASPRTSSNISTFIPPSERLELPRNMFVTSIDVEWRTGQGRTHWENTEESNDAPADDAQVVQSTDTNDQGSVDWMVIETMWDRYEKVDTLKPLAQGMIVAWKAFGLDPVTLTPQASLLYVGKVVSVNTEDLVVQPLTRPGVNQATFGRISIEQEGEPAEQIVLPLTGVWSSDWRLVHKQ